MVTFSACDPSAFKEVDAALQRIAEAAARAGAAEASDPDPDGVDWSDVYAAKLEVHRLLDGIMRGTVRFGGWIDGR